jgi:hypothetical protein
VRHRRIQQALAQIAVMVVPHRLPIHLRFLATPESGRNVRNDYIMVDAYQPRRLSYVSNAYIITKDDLMNET